MAEDKFRFYALWLCLACIIVFFLQFIPGFENLFILSSAHKLEIWRYISALFLHGSVIHLAYNLFALALFGSSLEAVIGSKNFLKIFFISGLISNILAVNVYTSSLGASGAIYGVIGALIIAKPLMPVWAFALPMPLFVAGILWIAGDFIGLFVPDDIGHVAHLAGMLAGVIIGIFYKPRNNSSEKRRERLKLDERMIRGWEDSVMR